MNDFQKFTSVPELLHDLVVGVVLLHHGIPVVPLKMLSHDVDSTLVVQGQVIQPFDKNLKTLVFWEANGSSTIFGFGDHQISHVLFLGLHGFDVKNTCRGGSSSSSSSSSSGSTSSLLACKV